MRERERVAETVAKIEGGPVSAMTERLRSITRDRHLIGVDGDQVRLEGAQQRVELELPMLAETPKQDE